MPVRRRSDRDRRWQVDFRIGGRRIRRLIDDPTISKRQAEAVERRWRQEAEGRQAGPAETWGALATRFWNDHAQHLSWQDSVSGHLEALSDFIGDRTRVGSISSDTFARAIESWRGQIGAQTINHRLGIARTLWNMASDLWGIPMPVIPWRKLRRPLPDRIPPYIPPAERQAIMDHASPHVRLAIQLALATGWRRGSVLGLRWEHIDWERELITGRGKGQAGGKILVHPLTTELQQILNQAGRRPSGPVVRYQDREVLSITRGFAAARKAAGVPHVLFRDLRHTVAQEILAETGSYGKRCPGPTWAWAG
jgi:integrase